MSRELPDYANATPEALASGCRAAVGECEERIAELLAVPAGRRTFTNTVLAVEEARAALREARAAWGVLLHVHPDGALRDTAQEWGERLEKHRIGVDLDERVHRAVREYAESAQAAALSGTDARLLAHLLRDYRRSGVDLPAEQRARIRALQEELVDLGSAFEAVLGQWRDGITVGREELDGLPARYVDELEHTEDGYRVSLDYPEFMPFMAEARSSTRRRELMEKDQSKGGPENVARVERALVARQEIAQILGYPSWAAYVIETRMAATPEAVTAFLDDLRDRAAVKASADLAEMAEASVQAGGSRELRLWDLPFAMNQLKQQRYAVDELAFAEYLPLENCLRGLFSVTGTLLGIHFEEVEQAWVWHPEVRTFDLCDAAGGAPFARFHLDLFPRPDKYKHAMAVALRPGRRLADGSWQQPVGALLVNLTRPGAQAPSLLGHSELVTLFHEFGHVLHDLLTRVEHGRYAGAETEIDFAEAPSQMLEHWCWEPEVLSGFARHHETGEPLPPELLGALVAAKNAGSGVQTMWQLAFATLDLEYHTAGHGEDSTAMLERVYTRHGLDHLEGTHLQSGFLHLFSYSAGYYSYLWSQAIGDDMYTRFAAAGPLDQATGAHYRRTVLERGGSVDAGVLVRDFLGREPSNAAFLRGNGLAGDV